MPIYEYKCNKCGEKFEALVRWFHSQKSLKCPNCGDKDIERIISTFSTDSPCGSPSEFHGFG